MERWQLPLRTALFTLLVSVPVTFIIPYLMAYKSWLPLPVKYSDWQWLGFLMMVAGLIMYILCVHRFGEEGQGTPAPIDPPRKLVIHGPYRFVRNPMYIAALCESGGITVQFASGSALIYTVCLWLAFHLFVTLYEEPHLKKVFGTDYEQYLKDVPRWLPRLRRTS